MEKIAFNPVVYNSSPARVTSQDEVVLFADAYREYRVHRDVLHRAERNGFESSSSLLLENVLGAKALVANIALGIYGDSESLEEFDERIKNVMNTTAIEEDAPSIGHVDRVTAARMYPLSLFNNLLPSAVESICITTEQLPVAADIARISKNYIDSIVLSGSNAWGPFYASHDVTPESRNDIRGNWPAPSDIDLVFVGKDGEQFEEATRALIGHGIFQPIDLELATNFRTLANEGRADSFTRHARHRGVEVSIHFVPEDLLINVSKMHMVNASSGEIDYFRDFRQPTEQQLKAFWSPKIGDLKSLAQVEFNQKFREAFTNSGKRLGHMANFPVGGQTMIGEEATYYIGFMAFYLLIAPGLLTDYDNRLMTHNRHIEDKCPKYNRQ